MTEEEAKTKWCPQCATLKTMGMISGIIPMMTSDKGAISEAVEVIGKALEDAKVSNCIASDCMMWVTETAENSTGISHVCGGHCGLAKQ